MSMHLSPSLTRRVSHAATIVAAVALLAGCGTDIRDRTEGGAATGAATGATIGLIGGPFGVIAGGLIGGGAGALTGAATRPSTVNLGEPVWSGR